MGLTKECETMLGLSGVSGLANLEEKPKEDFKNPANCQVCETVSCIDNCYVEEVDKSYCLEYFSISPSFCRTNLPKSVKTYALEPFGESFSSVGSTNPSSTSSLMLWDRVFLSTTFSKSLHLCGSLERAINIRKLPVLDSFFINPSNFPFIQQLLVLFQFILLFNNIPTFVGKTQTLNMLDIN